MKDDTVVTLRQPGEFADPLTEVLRNGARTLLAQAIEAEVADFFAANADLTTNDAARAARSSAGADHPDRHRPGRGPPAAGSRSRRGWCRADPLFPGDLAALCAADQ
jgi:hypothetical protein